VILLFAALAAASPDLVDMTFPAEGMEVFDVDATSMELEVSAVRALGMVEVRCSPLEWTETCRIQAEHKQGRARLFVLGASPPLKKCRVACTATIPDTSAIDIALQTGSVKLVETSAPATVVLGVGSVELEAVLSPLQVDLKSGSVSGNFAGPTGRLTVGTGGVHLDGLVKPIEVTAKIGNIGLTYGIVPEGAVVATTTTGSITVLLPEGAEAQTQCITSIGKCQVRVPESAGAPTRIVATTTMGGVLVTTHDDPRGQKRAKVDR
jgi:hypothetical protein